MDPLTLADLRAIEACCAPSLLRSSIKPILSPAELRAYEAHLMKAAERGVTQALLRYVPTVRGRSRDERNAHLEALAAHLSAQGIRAEYKPAGMDMWGETPACVWANWSTP